MFCKVICNHLITIFINNVGNLYFIKLTLLRGSSVGIKRFQLGFQHHEQTLLGWNHRQNVFVLSPVFLVCSVRTSMRLNLITDVKLILQYQLSARSLVIKLQSSMKVNSCSSGLVGNDNINLSIIKLSCYIFLVWLDSRLFSYGSVFIENKLKLSSS